MIVEKNEQKGFTLVELITVIAIVSLLAIYLSVEMGDAGEDAKVAMASAFLLSNVPTAINSFRARHAGSCTFAANATAELKDRGLFPDTPWGDSWSAAYDTNARQLTVAFPTTHAENTVAAAQDIGLSAHGKPQVVAATGGATFASGTVGTPAVTITGSGAITTSATDFGKNYFVSCTPSTTNACITYDCN